MPRTDKLEAQQQDLLPILAQAFSDLGYRRATTAEIARRCGVRENILYRHWNDKAAMFVAALDYVHDLAIGTWQRTLAGPKTAKSAAKSSAANLLNYEAQHLGEFGNYRIIFSALGETDTPEIKKALRRMYRSFHRLIGTTLGDARGGHARVPDVDHSAWAIIGLGTIATILGEVGLLSGPKRVEMIRAAGKLLIEGRPGS